MLDAFYRENYPIVYGYLLSLCGDAAQAEELTSETFCRAVEKIHRYDPRYRPSTWLCTIGRNLFFNECRRNHRMTELEAAECLYVPSAELVYLEKETVSEIWEILKSCSADHRQVFIMRLEGMTFRQIALALGKSENWARVTYFRIKSKILQEMEGKI